MANKKIIPIGTRFNRLKVLCDVGNEHVFCVCDCGNLVVAVRSTLRKGTKQSCNCFQSDATRERNRILARRHGMSRTTDYRRWQGILARCENTAAANYSDYGGRGIKVCERWHSFENYFADVGACPSEKYSLDRIDNDGPYSPGNCRWATRAEQGANTRRTVLLTFNGETRCREEWARRTGIEGRTLRQRLSLGWSVERALTEKVTLFRKGGKPV